MPQAKKTLYSGPMTRNQLLALNQYVASAGFPTLGKWDRAQSSDIYVVKGTVARDEPVQLTVVCDLNSDHHFVQPQGNYNVNYMPNPDTIGRKVKLLMTVQRPSSDPELGEDFVTTLGRVVGLQAEVAKTPVRKNLVVNGEQLRLSFFLFEPRSIYDEDEEDEIVPEPTDEQENTSDTETIGSDISKGKQKELTSEQSSSDRPIQGEEETYRVPYSFQSLWRDTEEMFKNRHMTVYGPDRRIIPYILFPKFLKPGTTIIASFNLVHHAFIEDRRTDKYLFDSYTANITKIVILDLHDSVPRSLSTPRKRSGFVSQTPPSHATLKAAADTFLPVASPSSPSPLTKPRSKKSKMPERVDVIDDTVTQTAIDSSSETTDSVKSTSPGSIPDASSQLSSMTAIATAGALGSRVAIDDNLMRLLLPVIAEYYRGATSSGNIVVPSPSQHSTDGHREEQTSASLDSGGNARIVDDPTTPPSASGSSSSVPRKRLTESVHRESSDISEGYVEVEGPENSRNSQPAPTPAENVGSSNDVQAASEDAQIRSSTERRESKRRR